MKAKEAIATTQGDLAEIAASTEAAERKGSASEESLETLKTELAGVKKSYLDITGNVRKAHDQADKALRKVHCTLIQ